MKRRSFLQFLGFAAAAPAVPAAVEAAPVPAPAPIKRPEPLAGDTLTVMAGADIYPGMLVTRWPNGLWGPLGTHGAPVGSLIGEALTGAMPLKEAQVQISGKVVVACIPPA